LRYVDTKLGCGLVKVHVVSGGVCVAQIVYLSRLAFDSGVAMERLVMALVRGLDGFGGGLDMAVADDDS
jgi:hypothetical protein